MSELDIAADISKRIEIYNNGHEDGERETVAAIVAWLRWQATNVYDPTDTDLARIGAAVCRAKADQLERGAWKRGKERGDG